MASSSSEDFDLFEALCSQPDLLELVVQQCSGNKNNLRLSCSRLRLAVDACVIGLAWTGLDPLVNEAKHMAVLARCPRLQTVDFNGRPVADLSPLASCVGLRSITNLCATSTRWGITLAPFASLTQLEHLGFCQCSGLSDISALAACTALKYLDCRIKQLPPLPSLGSLKCSNTPLTAISALVNCIPVSLKHLDFHGCNIATIPPLPAGLETLNIYSTLCVNLSPLTACVGLRSLNCSGTTVRDLAPLAACAGLRSLDCSHTWVQDLAPLTSCAELRSLDCRDTLVEDLMPLLACTRLEMLECSDFDVINVHARQLRRARPDLNIIVSRSHDDDDDDSEEDD